MTKRRVPLTGGPDQPSPRFTGRQGRRNLVEALKSQVLVSNEQTIAKALAQVGTLSAYKKETILIKQGDPDNDILFIVHGEVQVLANDRSVALRVAGTHVGEMALVDHLARRSATIKATEPTTVLRVAENKFSQIAKQFPDLWRRVAVEIAKRLRERNKLLTPPHEEPVVFIGSSSEGSDLVDVVHAIAKRWTVVPKPWTEGVFQASSTTIESLVAVTKEADYAVLILTADDVTKSRGINKPSPRDNVVFELGLLMGALGRERVFILKPKNVDIRIPTDLLGVTWLEYRKGGPGSLRHKLAIPCRTIRKRIEYLGPK